MVNKFWYEGTEEELLIARKSIQNFINLYCFDEDEFKVVEDITPENVGKFLEIMLKHYEQYHFRASNLSYALGENLHLYFHRAYMDEFPDNYYPTYSDSDKRTLAMNVIEYIEIGRGYTVLAEDVPYLIEYLNTPDAQIEQAHAKIEAYFNQFDHDERCNIEAGRRWEAICGERLEAIKNNKPLPIKPMSIELSLCYKKPRAEQAG